MFNITTLKRYEDARGHLFEVFRTTDLPIVMAYCVYTKPGQARDDRAWHCHYTKREYFISLSGMVALALSDGKDVHIQKLGPSRTELVEVPLGILHSLKNIGDEPALTLVLCDNFYDPGDEIRTPFTSWNWSNV